MVCPLRRVAQYKLLRIERGLFEQTQASLRAWTSSILDQTPEPGGLYYTTLGKLAEANHRCLIRMNEIRKRLDLPPIVDDATYPVKEPLDDE